MKKIFIPLLILFFAFGVTAQSGNLPDSGLTPDSPLYFLKAWKESIQTFFTFGAENKAKQYLHLADVRLNEYQNLIDKGKTEIADKTLAKYEKQLNQALDKASELKQKGSDVTDLSQKIEETVGKHLEVLQENLQKVPEQAKKGIENAIENSQKELDKILQKSMPCTEEGKTGSPNEINCCEGLKAYTNYELDSMEKCVQIVEPGKHLVCIDCGNNICEQGENICNCPQDCEKKETCWYIKENKCLQTNEYEICRSKSSYESLENCIKTCGVISGKQCSGEIINVTVEDLVKNPERFLGKEVRVSGKLVLTSKTYFPNPEVGISDGTNIFPVSPWLPTEIPPPPPGRGDTDQPITMQYYLNKNLTLRGIIKSGEIYPKRGSIFYLDVTGVEIDETAGLKTCNTDANCACGVKIGTATGIGVAKECFYGNKKYVNALAQCPDFCSGIDGKMQIKCVNNFCAQVSK